jgi:hypothetical protein
MRRKDKFRLFYVHTPKTAGSSLNEYFKKIFPNHATHIEGQLARKETFKLDNYDFASGHIGLNRAERILNDNWIKLITLREPYSFVISHLCWIRLLADSDQVDRFKRHPPIIQKVSKKMSEYDFSDAEQISEFIIWLDGIDYNYLHNTQTFYLDFDKRIDAALEALDRVEFVGTMERVDEFLGMINNCLNLGYEYSKTPRENVNSRKYGLDINNDKIRAALYPLINKDILVYEAASSRLKNDLNMHQSLQKDYEIKGVVDRVNEDRISGWVMSPQLKKVLTVGLYRNSELLHEVKANIFRLGLKKRGVHYTGCAGFVIELGGITIKSGDVFSIRDVRSGKVIPLGKGLQSSASSCRLNFSDETIV